MPAKTWRARNGGLVGCDTRWSGDVLDELRALYAPLRRYAAVVGRYDVDPDDLVQEAFAKFLLVPNEHVRDPRAYLRRTIVNLATNERRRNRRAVAAIARTYDAGTTEDRYPSELADLLRLDGRIRGLLYLVEVEGEPIAVAAEAVGMTATAARMALSRARRRLRDELSEERSGE